MLAAAEVVVPEVATELVADAPANLAAVRHHLLQIPVHVLHAGDVPVAVELPLVGRGLHLLLKVRVIHLNVPVVPDLHPRAALLRNAQPSGGGLQPGQTWCNSNLNYIEPCYALEG